MTMKRSKTLTYCDNLRDVITIHLLSNGELIVMAYDKITGRREFLDDMDDTARRVIETHPDTVACH